MKRLLLAAALAIAACDRAPPPPEAPVEAEVWQANARDRLCLKGNRAGFIVYGLGNANCSARGRAVRSDDQASLVPDGESRCVFVVELDGGSATLRPGSGGGCGYYCAPGAAIGATAWTRAPAGASATDLAGEPLC